jgi:hypothetical protein
MPAEPGADRDNNWSHAVFDRPCPLSARVARRRRSPFTQNLETSKQFSTPPPTVARRSRPPCREPPTARGFPKRAAAGKRVRTFSEASRTGPVRSNRLPAMATILAATNGLVDLLRTRLAEVGSAAALRVGAPAPPAPLRRSPRTAPLGRPRQGSVLRRRRRPGGEDQGARDAAAEVPGHRRQPRDQEAGPAARQGASTLPLTAATTTTTTTTTTPLLLLRLQRLLCLPRLHYYCYCYSYFYFYFLTN